jgi:hypothetical protein
MMDPNTYLDRYTKNADLYVHHMSYGLYVYLYCIPHNYCPEWCRVRFKEIHQQITKAMRGQ